MEIKRPLPLFKYNPLITDNMEYFSTEENVCDCCGEKTTLWTNNMYCREEVNCICVHCIADGSAAEKFDGEFIDWFEAGVTDESKKDELLHRTPGYPSWQGERWMVHCEDYCQYLGEVDAEDLRKYDDLDEIIKETELLADGHVTLDELEKGGSPCCHMFKCLHCGKIRLDIEFD